MLRTDKERIVSELASELGSAETLIVADYRGLTNKQLEALRDELLQHGARFRIVKNTLSRRAATQAGADALLVMLEGPTAIAFIESGGDPAAVAKALASKAKGTNVLTLRGGILEGKTLSGAEVDRLATLPPVDVLRGQLLGAIVAPLTQLVALLSAPLQNLHGLVDARIKQLEERGDGSAPATATGAGIEVASAETDQTVTEVDTADTPADSAAAESDDQEASEDSVPRESVDIDTEQKVDIDTEQKEE